MAISCCLGGQKISFKKVEPSLENQVFTYNTLLCLQIERYQVTVQKIYVTDGWCTNQQTNQVFKNKIILKMFIYKAAVIMTGCQICREQKC